MCLLAVCLGNNHWAEIQRIGSDSSIVHVIHASTESRQVAMNVSRGGKLEQEPHRRGEGF